MEKSTFVEFKTKLIEEQKTAKDCQYCYLGSRESGGTDILKDGGRQLIPFFLLIPIT